MAWLNTFLEKLLPTKQSVGGSLSTLVIDIPADLYYKELALHTAISLISNAISRAEIKVFQNHKAVKNNDYYLLNISPNDGESSTYFWHKIINDVVRKEEALVVEKMEKLYVAESYTIANENPVSGNTYTDVKVGNIVFPDVFRATDYYLFRLDNINVKRLIDGLYQEYSKLLSSAAKAFQKHGTKKYRLKLSEIRQGDDDFFEVFESHLQKELESYMKSDCAVYPELDGYELIPDGGQQSSITANDIVNLKNCLFSMVAQAFHIPDSMLNGNITNIADVVSSFLTFGVDPYADMITEVLNKRCGAANFARGNYYAVDTGRVGHRDIFAIAPEISSLLSSGIMNIDELRDEIGLEQLGTAWSRKYYMTKNFTKIEEIE